MTRILLLEDDISLIDGLTYSLRKNDFDVNVVRTVREALSRLCMMDLLPKAAENMVAGSRADTDIGAGAVQNPFDLLILDVTLPDGSGFEVCEKVRERDSQIPIIFLTASDEEVNVIRGLDSGGDDYITKPFKVGELCSRIRALLRRTQNLAPANPAPNPATGNFSPSPAPANSAQNPAPGNSCPALCQAVSGLPFDALTETPVAASFEPLSVISSGGLTIDLSGCRAVLNGKKLDLTGAEYRLLCFLVRRADRVVTRNSILNELWDGTGDFVDDNTLSVYVRRLREKLEEDPSHPKYLVTVRGFGYQWVSGGGTGARKD